MSSPEEFNHDDFEKFATETLGLKEEVGDEKGENKDEEEFSHELLVKAVESQDFEKAKEILRKIRESRAGSNYKHKEMIKDRPIEEVIIDFFLRRDVEFNMEKVRDIAERVKNVDDPTEYIKVSVCNAKIGLHRKRERKARGEERDRAEMAKIVEAENKAHEERREFNEARRLFDVAVEECLKNKKGKVAKLKEMLEVVRQSIFEGLDDKEFKDLYPNMKRDLRYQYRHRGIKHILIYAPPKLEKVINNWKRYKKYAKEEMDVE